MKVGKLLSVLKCPITGWHNHKRNNAMTKLFNFFPSPEKKRGDLIKCINTFANESRKARAYKRKYWNLADRISAYEKHRQIELFTDSITYDKFEDIIFFWKEKYRFRTSTLTYYYNTFFFTFAMLKALTWQKLKKQP